MSTVKTNNVQVGQSLTATNNFTLYQPTVPDGTVRLGVGNTGATTADVASFTSAGLFSFNSGYGSAAVAYGCRAWVNFNGTGTVAIRASGNVSSITDDGVGLFRVNMTNAMSDSNYSFVATIGGAAGNFLVRDNSDAVTKTTTQFRINCATISGPTDVDPPQVNVVVFR